MSIKSRGEKIDEFLENAKRVLINTLLLIWAVITIFLAICLVGNRMEINELKGTLNQMEVQLKSKETKQTETTYVVIDGHKYMVVDTAW